MAKIIPPPPERSAQTYGTDKAKDTTKREHFAFEFCKKFLEHDLAKERDQANTMAIAEIPQDPCKDNAKWSVRQADELIKALNEEKKDD